MPLMTPRNNLRLEKVLRALGFKTTPLFFKDFTLWMTDEHYSKTLEIVYSEWADGFYNPPLALRPNDVVIDVGAHVGLFTIPLAKKYPLVTFVCYEPNPINYTNLLKNIKRNKIKNVIALKFGLWSHATTIECEHDNNNTGSSTSKEDLNSFIRALPLEVLLVSPSTRLLKLDCEGPERFVTLKDLETVESLLCEVHYGNKAKLHELAKHPYSRICEPGPNGPVYGTSPITRKYTKELPLG